MKLCHMHRASLSSANAGSFAVDFGHHRPEIHPFGDAVAVPAMCAGHIVFFSKMHRDSRRRRFFAGVQVNEPGNFPGREFHVHSFLEVANPTHCLVSLP
jgi:hypothetical protein